MLVVLLSARYVESSTCSCNVDCHTQLISRGDHFCSRVPLNSDCGVEAVICLSIVLPG